MSESNPSRPGVEYLLLALRRRIPFTAEITDAGGPFITHHERP